MSDSVKSFKKHKRRKKYLSGIKIILALFFVSFVVFRFAAANNVFVNTVPVSHGSIEHKVVAEGLILREEILVTAPGNGIFRAEVEAGDRVREEQVLGTFTSTNGIKTEISASSSGLVSYMADNYEHLLNPEDYEELSIEKAMSIEGGYEDLQHEEVLRGFPVLRIANNHRPLMIIVQVGDEVIDAIESKGIRNLMVNLNGDDVRTEILDVFPGKNYICLEYKNWGEWLLDKRKHDFEIIVSRYSGSILPDSAILEVDGEIGVYTYNQKEYAWQPVDVIYSSKNEVAVSGIDEEGVEVVINPKWAKILQSI